VKTLSADGSVGSPHVRVGHRQAFIQRKPFPQGNGFFVLGKQLRRFGNFIEEGCKQIEGIADCT
jgi:hypothetical protein